MASAFPDDCPICCDPFNKMSRKPVDCGHPGCNFVACRLCTQRTILDNTGKPPECMNCHKTWDREFLEKKFTKVFLKSKIRDHRATILLEYEKSMIQATMPLVDNEMEARNIERVKIAKLQRKMEKAYQKAERLQIKIDNAKDEAHRLRNNGESKIKKERSKFTRPCPVDDCRGFLSSQYKCGVCEQFTCSKCNAILGTKEERKELDHECDPNDVESIEAIKKDTKPCPKCHIRLSKINGCDHFFCTQCHTSFSWKTGKITSGNAGNPQ